MAQMYKALQIAFNWSDVHCYDFTIAKSFQPSYSLSASVSEPFGPVAVSPAHWYPDWKHTENIPCHHLARVPGSSMTLTNRQMPVSQASARN